MRIKTLFKIILEKYKRKPFLKNKKMVYFEKGNSFFDPCVFKSGDSNFLVISNRKFNSIDLFKINEDKSLSKIKTILSDKNLREKNILLNRASLYNDGFQTFIFFTLQVNGRSYIYKRLSNDFKEIDERDTFLTPTEFFENNSTMNPSVYRIFDDNFLFYSSGETFEPDNICLCKINNIQTDDIEKYNLNPIFTKGSHYYNFSKVAFGDFLSLDSYFLLFYIGYLNVNKAYINLAYCRKTEFPYFKDLTNINPLIGPGKKCLNAVYKPGVFDCEDYYYIYYNGRTRNTERIFMTKVSKDLLLSKIKEIDKKLKND